MNFKDFFNLSVQVKGTENGRIGDFVMVQKEKNVNEIIK